MSYGRQLRGKLCIGLKHEELKTLKKKKKDDNHNPLPIPKGCTCAWWVAMCVWIRAFT